MQQMNSVKDLAKLGFYASVLLKWNAESELLCCCHDTQPCLVLSQFTSIKIQTLCKGMYEYVQGIQSGKQMKVRETNRYSDCNI